MTRKRGVATAVILCAQTVALADCSRSSVGPSEITESPGELQQLPGEPPPLGPPVSVAGDYTLTFIADSACVGIPIDLRTRTYDATIVPGHPLATPGTGFSVRINGVSAVPGLDGIAVDVSGNVVTFQLDADGWPHFVEQVTPDWYFAFDGRIVIDVPSASLSSFSTSFYGGALYGHSPTVSQRCESRNHQLVVTRR